MKTTPHLGDFGLLGHLRLSGLLAIDLVSMDPSSQLVRQPAKFRRSKETEAGRFKYSCSSSHQRESQRESQRERGDPNTVRLT